MKMKIGLFVALSIVSFMSLNCAQLKIHPVYVGTEMSSGYDLGLNTNKGIYNWISDSTGFMRIDYPADQLWGTLFITVGKIKDLPQKKTVDLSAYKKLCFELKSNIDEQMLEIGMKDAQDIDDGQETTVPLYVNKEWQSYEIDLSDFKTADMKQICVLMEIVLGGSHPQTVYFRNIHFK